MIGPYRESDGVPATDLWAGSVGTAETALELRVLIPVATAAERAEYLVRDHNDDMNAQFSLASYSRTIAADLDDMDRYCALMHQLPRQFHRLTESDQAEALLDPPPLTGTRWDALLAAVVEHIARLHRHQVPEWVNEPDRFLAIPWVISSNPVIAADSVLYAPASRG